LRQASPSSGQIISRKKAWISLDSLVRIEPFQTVIVAPRAEKRLLPRRLDFALIFAVESFAAFLVQK
jgi:hypothetical protein